ncbi:MAG: flavodoxin domain-containing protein [Verrucomicrobiota bacterium]
MLVLFATQTGNAKTIAEKAVEQLDEAGFKSAETDLAEYALEDLKNEQDVLVIASTWGEGEPPDECIDFYEDITSRDPLGLSNLRFAVLALGDSSYENFCQHGKDLDHHLERHGGKRLIDCVECDLDEEEQLPEWVNKLVSVLRNNSAS